MNICTIIAKNYIAHARVLAESFREHHPDGVCTVLILDDPEKVIKAEVEPFEVLRFEEIGAPKSPGLPRYDVEYFADLVKPWLFQFLLGGGTDHLIYLDPDIQVFAPLDDIGWLAKQHGLLLTSRIAQPIPQDREKPTEHEILSTGVYDLGFIALGASETAMSFLKWWSEGLLNNFSEEEDRYVFIDGQWNRVYERPLFDDRTWIGLIPSLFPEMKVIQDPGCNLAYWNLHARTLEKDGAIVTVDGQRLKFFHFSGFRPELPYWLSRHATRVKVSENVILAELCESYAALLKEHGYDEAIRTPYRYGQLPNGITYDERLHQLYRKALKEGEDFGDVFEPGGAQVFLRWLNAPARQGGRHGVTRFMYDGIYVERRDVQRDFKNLDGPDGVEFVRWFAKHGRRVYDLPDLLIPEPDRVGFVRRLFAKHERHQYDPPPQPSPTNEGVNVVGFLKSGVGLGEAARGYVSALKAAGIPVTTSAITTGLPTGVEVFDAGDKDPQNAPAKYRSTDEVRTTNPYSTNLVCVNPQELSLFYEEVGKAFFENRHTIGVWAWETNSIPERWLPSFKLVDEIWVYTNHVAENLSQVSPVPVFVVPPPVTAPDPGDATVDLGIPEGFTFLFLFDFYSVSYRKNPLGLIEAFKRAFAPEEGPQLLVKSIHGAQTPELLEHLKFESRDRPDIHIVDRYVSLREKTALMAGCDCYVSLHRAEGFGLTMAEAMSLGKPVIATGYSGNVDFMNAANSYLVDYTMAEIGEGITVYSEVGGTWAEPDLDHAAQLMRHVWENQDEARARGERARRDIERMLSPEAVGKIAQARLNRSAELQTDPASATTAPSLPQRRRAHSGTQGNAGGQLQVAQRMLKQEPALEALSRLGRVGRFARRLILRAMRPFTFYQRQVDTAIIGTLQETMESSLEAIETVQSSLETRLAQLEADARKWDEAIEGRIDTLERDTTEEMHRLSAELSKATSDLQTKPNISHPLLSYTDESGNVVLGFRDAGDGFGESETYWVLDDVFRGDERRVKNRQAWYADLVADRSWVLNVGCRRGEFLDLLRDRGIKGKGVEGDEAMVKRCHDKGHDVVLSDANAYLREEDDGSIPAIFATQTVVERLSYEDLLEFLRLANAKLEAEGLLILEATNYHSLEAVKEFWLDPSKRRPVLPEAALALCRLAGFQSGRVVLPNGPNNLEKALSSARTYAVLATKTTSDPITERQKMRRNAIAQQKELSADEVRAAIAQVENWFHPIEVAPGITTPGVSDSAATLEAMALPDRLDGERILDVGARDGYFSFAAEARGAEVLAIDSVAPHLTGFETAASLLGSSVDYKTANVYDLRPEEIGTFDGIFFLGVLYHLRDPMLALDRLWKLARPGATIWIESQVIDHFLVDPATGKPQDLSTIAPALTDIPIAQFYSKAQLEKNYTNWWAPNFAGLKAMIEAAGFAIVQSRLLGGRAMIVGRKVEDARVSFFREFDRRTMTGDEGMAWNHMKQIADQDGAVS